MPDRPPRWLIIGTHGGAGATTVTRMLDPRCEGRAVELGRGQSYPGSGQVLLVTRSTAYGLAMASRLVVAWNPALSRPWLVVVADAPARPPLPVRYRLRALGSQVRGVVTLPYLHRLRAVDDVADVLSVRAVARAAASLADRLSTEEEPCLLT